MPRIVLFALLVCWASGLRALQIVTPAPSEALPDAMEGEDYPAFSCSAMPATDKTTWKAKGLPPGMQCTTFFTVDLNSGLSITVGSIEGTPDIGSGGKTYNVTVEANDGSGGRDAVSVTLTVHQPVQFTSTGQLGIAPLGVPFTAQLDTIGGYLSDGGSLTFFVSVGSLPPGLSLDPVTGVLSGVVQVPGASTFYVMVQDEWSIPTADTLVCKVTFVDPLDIVVSSSMPPAEAGTPYVFHLAAKGGMAPYTWAVVGLPPSLAVNAQGVISGTPLVSDIGHYDLQVSVTDSDAPPSSDNTILSLDIEAADLVLLTALTLPAAQAGVPYLLDLQAMGGVAPYHWSVAGLPSSLSLSTSGAISGTPNDTETGVYALKTVLTDSAQPPVMVPTILSLRIEAAGTAPLTVTTSYLFPAMEGVSYTHVLNASGGDAPYQWTITGLPQGLTPNGNEIHGTPLIGSAGIYFVKAIVTDAEGLIASTILKLVVKGQSQSAPANSDVESGGSNAPTPDLVGAAAAGCSIVGNANPERLWLTFIVVIFVMWFARLQERVQKRV
ncbi:MAG: putative Ig domain-containing protein [Planctomycetaceae bacterium]|nr:putative Ig domain-containing protein [Planctomycetaceae bacterium]